MSAAAHLSPVSNVDQAQKLLTPAAVAERLSVSRSLIYTFIRSGKLRALYVGRLPRIPASELERFLASLSEARA